MIDTYLFENCCDENDELQYLYQEGLDYSINNDVITISNSSCMDNFTDKTIYLNITIDCGI